MAAPSTTSKEGLDQDNLSDAPSQPLLCLPRPPEWICNWKCSSISRSHLEQLVKMGGLLEFTEMASMVPRLQDAVPQPLPWNQVVHVAFVHRGLRLPLSPFARGVLAPYGLQLHHLTPSGMLLLSCFATLYKYFLGIHLRFDLFRYFFKVVPCLKDDRIPSCGGTIIHPCPGSN